MERWICPECGGDWPVIETDCPVCNAREAHHVPEPHRADLLAEVEATTVESEPDAQPEPPLEVAPGEAEPEVVSDPEETELEELAVPAYGTARVAPSWAVSLALAVAMIVALTVLVYLLLGARRVAAKPGPPVKTVEMFGASTVEHSTPNSLAMAV